jgi:dolichyl-phosphate-mannose-protein mannosyltransferase
MGDEVVDLDNAQLSQQRLILLDATLVFSMAMSVWTYIRFYRHRHQPFSKPWWRWLIATGVSLSFVMSTKYVGLFTFFTIGGAVAVDLWNLLDYRRGLPIVPPPTTKSVLADIFRENLVAILQPGFFH